jgi:hypothetical protein
LFGVVFIGLRFVELGRDGDRERRWEPVNCCW